MEAMAQATSSLFLCFSLSKPAGDVSGGGEVFLHISAVLRCRALQPGLSFPLVYLFLLSLLRDAVQSDLALGACLGGGPLSSLLLCLRWSCVMVVLVLAAAAATAKAVSAAIADQPIACVSRSSHL